MNILLVDSDRELLNNLQKGFMEHDYGIICFTGISEAQKCIAANILTIDVVVINYNQPDENGLKALQFLRGKYHELPLILLGSADLKNMVALAMHNDIDGFLKKPFTLDELINEIERVFSYRDKLFEKMKNRVLKDKCEALLSSLSSLGTSIKSLDVEKFPERQKKQLVHTANSSDKVAEITRELITKFEKNISV